MKHLSCWVGRLILALKFGLPGLSIVAIFWNLDRRAPSESRLAEFDFYGFLPLTVAFGIYGYPDYRVDAARLQD
jgi:hypothetical protein